MLSHSLRPVRVHCLNSADVMLCVAHRDIKFEILVIFGCPPLSGHMSLVWKPSITHKTSSGGLMVGDLVSGQVRLAYNG